MKKIGIIISLVILFCFTFSISQDNKLIEPTTAKTQIALHSNRDGNFEIYVMNSDGTNQVNLTNNPAEDTHASWSSDGRNIAFQTDRDGNKEIYLMNADGSEQKRLTSNRAKDTHPTWSPDGQKISFQSDRDRNEEIYVMNADGNKITFSSVRIINKEMYYAIYIMNTDGSEQKRLTDSGIANNPSWSPFLK